MKEHIVSTYDDDLNTLKTKLLEMGVLVERQIFQAIEITKIINLFWVPLSFKKFYLQKATVLFQCYSYVFSIASK